MKSKSAWLEMILLLAPLVVLALLWRDLPARVPVHWNLHDQIDRWEPKWPGLMEIPLIGVLLTALLYVLPRLDPKLRRDSDDAGRTLTVIAIIRVTMLALLNLTSYLQIAVSLGWHVEVGRLITIAVLLLFAVIGNFLGNLRPNYFVGIRTPWTLEDAATWRATHRLGGRLIFFGALTLLILEFLLAPKIFVVVLLSALLALLIWSVFYSWHYFRIHSRTNERARIEA